MVNQRAQEIPELRFQVPVREILTSDLGSWLAQLNRLKPNSYSDFASAQKHIQSCGQATPMVRTEPYGTRPSSLFHPRISFFSSCVSAGVGGGSLVAHPTISKRDTRARVIKRRFMDYFYNIYHPLRKTKTPSRGCQGRAC